MLLSLATSLLSLLLVDSIVEYESSNRGHSSGFQMSLPSPHWVVADSSQVEVIYGVSASSKRSGFHRFIEVPKRWFTHFYMTAAVVTSAALVITILAYCYGARPPLLLRDCLRTLGQPHASASGTGPNGSLPP